MNGITLTIEELDRLLALRDGDAALLYLSDKRGGGETLFSDIRLREARKKLSLAGLSLSERAERPAYNASEIAQGMLTDPGYHMVVNEAERLLGRTLSPQDLQILFSVYKWRGLPPGVMLMLMHHCADTLQRNARPFTMRQLDKEAELWEREGIFDESAAERYIARLDASREESAKVFGSLGIFGRDPTATEKKYVSSWLEMGFSVEAIALAYDRTVVNTGKLAWGYCDKILKRWHDNNWHAPKEIEARDKKNSPAKGDEVTGSVDRTRQALKRIKGER